jgi:hypothetical protein
MGVHDYLIIAIRTKVIHLGSATIGAAPISGSGAPTHHRLRSRLWFGRLRLWLWLWWLRNWIRNWDRNRSGLRLRSRIGLNNNYMTHKSKK